MSINETFEPVPNHCTGSFYILVAVVGRKESIAEEKNSSNEKQSDKKLSLHRKLKIYVMPQMINYGSEMLKISPKGIEYSTSGGRSWYIRYSGSSCGTFMDLLPYGNELLAVTSKGVYYSTSQGRSWYMRYSGSSCGNFLSLADGGRELLANTSKGLYYSTSAGRSWYKRN